ncbi:hypothetical protein ACS15_0620 [Ralstonia insidiosa]|uniref:Uncharacterized protein n=1 Tax=Ralstonia insidiosa TaxID=190721 RepID=A0AAC9FRE6_9RALS|nr:hypothetical protein ACS15_0620 [Ralstonia insidiosa]
MRMPHERRAAKPPCYRAKLITALRRVAHAMTPPSHADDSSGIER